MAKKVVVINQILGGYWYEVGLLTKEDSKNYNIKFKSDKYLTEADIKTTLERVTECYVESIKRVSKYAREKVQNPADYGVAITGRYTMLGEKIYTDSIFLPNVKKAYIEQQSLETELKEFFGTDFEISVYSPRI